MYYENNDILCIIFAVVFIALLVYFYKLGEQMGYKKAREEQRRRRFMYNRYRPKR